MPLVHGLHFNNIKGDIYGGVTAGVIALPLALAFGVSSGAGPIAGLYGAIFVGLFAALFGGTPTQISGPTGPMTVVMAVVFTQYTALYPDNPQYGAALAFTVVIMGGLFQILFGLLKLGKYINLMPHPVISGFMSGIGVIIILLQLGPLFGHAAQSKPLAAVMDLPNFLGSPIADALIVGCLALAIVYLLPNRINRILPAPLLALVVGTLVLTLFFPETKAPILGDIPTGIPIPHMPAFEWSLISEMIQSSLTLAALGSIDSLLTSLVADNITRSHHNSDRELIGQGIGNTVAGIFGGLPGAGATMRTVVNVKAGGQTPISGALHALLLLAIILGAGVLASHVPLAVLAGILIKVGTDIIDWDYIKRLKTAPRAGVIVMLTVLLTTVFVDLMVAVGIGVVMASLILMHRVTEMQLDSIKAITAPDAELPLNDAENKIMEQTNGRILLYHLGGPMSFGAAKGMTRRLAAFDQYDVLILDLSAVTSIDFTAARALEDMIHHAEDVGRHAFIVGIHTKVQPFLSRQGVLALLPEGRLFSVRLDAMKNAAVLINSSIASSVTP